MSKIPVRNACVTGCVSDSSSHPMGDPLKPLLPLPLPLLSDPCACPEVDSSPVYPPKHGLLFSVKICTFEQNYYQSN